MRLTYNELNTDTKVDLSKRNFLRVGGVAAVGTLTLTGFKCGSENVTRYTATITAFLNEIATLLPAQANFISQTIKIAAQFDQAYRRGDFANASTFFNTLAGNVTELFNNLGINVSSQVKVALAIVSTTIKLIAVLLQDQGAAQPVAVTGAEAVSPAVRSTINLIRRLASPASVDATYQASKLQ